MNETRIVVVGNFGRGNVGDDLLLDTLLAQVQAIRPHAHVRVLSPGGARVPSGAAVRPEPIPLRRPWVSVPRLASAVMRADVLVVGPGGIVNDLFPGLLPGLSMLARAVRARRGRVGLIGVGMGPFRTSGSGVWLRRLTAAADVISVRDQGSLDQLPPEARVRCQVGTDLAWASAAPAVGGERRGMVISLRPWRWDGEPQLEVAVAAARRFLHAHPGEPVELLAMDRRLDPPVLRRLRAMLPEDAPVSVEGMILPRDLADRLGQRREVLAMRYHAGLVGALSGCRLALIGYDPKVLSLGETLGVPVWEPGLPLRMVPEAVGSARIAEARASADVHRQALMQLLR